MPVEQFITTISSSAETLRSSSGWAASRSAREIGEDIVMWLLRKT